MKSTMLVAALGLSLMGPASGADVTPPGADLPREGTGARRDALDRMELAPFDQALWDGLSDWTNGAPLDAAGAKGKVVLIYTWTSYLPTALRPISTLQRLQQQYGPQGLVVVGVHQDAGWADAAAQLEQRGGKFLIAHDAKGTFRDAIMVDQDPDFYLVDRAGQVRFADLDTSAVTRAVEILVAETAEEARTLNERLEAERKAAEVDFGRTHDIRQEVHLSDIPELPFPAPSAEAYEAVKWPKVVDEEDRNHGREPPPPGSLPSFDEGAFFPSKPNFAGRVTVAYFFNPKVYRSYQYLDEASRLQKAHGRDVVVLGVMTPENDPDRRSNRDEPKITPEQWASDFLAFAKTREPKHTLVSDQGATLVEALNPGNRGRREGDVLALGAAPYVVVASSDGTIRWHGPASSRWFKFMLDETLRLDPGVAARREVEESYRRTQRSG
jgi:hypothetical protein